MPRLAEGAQAPDFCLQNQFGESIHLSQFTGSPVAVFFYPKDFTPGCTAQVCGFRDQSSTFKQMGAVVLGISGDATITHQRFSQQHQVPFHLLSDPGNTVRTAWGVPKTLGLLPGRVTYVLDKGLIVRRIFSSQFNIDGHIQQALAALQSNQPQGHPTL